MIELPGELVGTVRLLHQMAPAGDKTAVLWPDIDEDQMGVHARSWSDAVATLNATVDDPMNTTGTIWKPAVPWKTGQDKPLDAFVDFWKTYPRAHYYRAATQASAVAGALSGIAGIVASFKISYLRIVQVAHQELSRTYHVLGADHTDLFVLHSGREASPDAQWDGVGGPVTLQQIASGETAERRSQDLTAIDTVIERLVDLSRTTHQQLGVLVNVIDQGTSNLLDIQTKAKLVSTSLPDQSYNEDFGNSPNLVVGIDSPAGALQSADYLDGNGSDW